jgi:hypothetical protein
MDWILPVIVGWCGTGFPFKWWGGRGGGGFDPDWPWPPNCWVCWGVLGAVISVVIDPIVRPQVADGGVFARIVVDFLAAGAGSTLVSGLYGMVAGKGRAG